MKWLDEIRRLLATDPRPAEHKARNESGEESIEVQAERRKAEAIRLGLHKAIESIFESIRFYPAWIEKRPDTCLPEVHDPKEISLKVTEAVSFEFNGRQYSVGGDDRYIDFPDGGGCRSRDYFLFDSNGNTLFSTSGHVDDDKYGLVSTYRFNEVTAYIPGDWTKDILELHQKLAIHNARQDATWVRTAKDEERKKLRKKFGL